MEKFDAKILSSSHLNFLFGAGVNGSAFPQLILFTKTIENLKTILNEDVKNFEESINKLKNISDKNKVFKIFKSEFMKFEKNIDYNSKSIKNIDFLFLKINRLVEESENRTKTTKQVNIFTLNYDTIVEDRINRLGYLINKISTTNVQNQDRFFNMIGYNYELKKFVPTYLVSKIHGEINNPVFPGIEKYDEVLRANRFEILFKMKEKLLRFNSILFVIGYSGHDEHINKILKDCVIAGLTIYWFKYKKDDYIPSELIDIIIKIENNEEMDTTLLCGNMVNQLWVESSEE